MYQSRKCIRSIELDEMMWKMSGRITIRRHNIENACSSRLCALCSIISLTNIFVLSLEPNLKQKKNVAMTTCSMSMPYARVVHNHIAYLSRRNIFVFDFYQFVGNPSLSVSGSDHFQMRTRKTNTYNGQQWPMSKLSMPKNILHRKRFSRHANRDGTTDTLNCPRMTDWMQFLHSSMNSCWKKSTFSCQFSYIFYVYFPAMSAIHDVTRNISLNRLHKQGPIYKVCSKRPVLNGQPFAKGVVIRTLIKKPRKPNSGNRKCVLVRLSFGKEMVAYVPGVGHNLQEHNTVLVRVGNLRDTPGVKIKCVRGAYDLPHVIKRTT